MRPDLSMARHLLVIGLLLACSSPAAADPSPQEAIEESLMCYCGCADLTVRVCTCGTAASMRQEIATHLAGGASVEEVLASFVARHGEKILSAPTKEGFNLLAWIMPFAVLLVATAALIVVIRRWETVGSAARAENRANPAADLSDAQRLTLERVEREMREDD
jgi:cytochrome c-type biogenesis protein CcmH